VSATLERTFRDLSDKDVADIEKASLFARHGWIGSLTWDELLLSKRVLIVSEAGSGKTYECRHRQKLLWEAGEPAFHLELATLSSSSVREMLNYEEERRFDEWLRSQSEVVTFFLDSIDELKLTLGSFDQALKRLTKAISGQISRVRIVITTRPVPVDRELIERHLAIPSPVEADPTPEAFADMMMDRGRKSTADDAAPKDWRYVGLMPLSHELIREFVILQNVTDPDALLDDVYSRDAIEFAQRPQDLIELCSDWREHRRIRTHQEQVESNIATKLKPSTERPERTQLSLDKAIEGASRLALAAILTRKLTLRYSADSDLVEASQAAMDVSKILCDWSADEQQTLLERPLFGFASYGRVRFHHRSTIEYLGAKRFESLLACGVSIKSIKRLLFTETAQGTSVVRPTMRPLAAWLALWRDTIFDDIVRLDPAVALDHGDPQSLRPAQRTRALEAYVARYGSGGWRGLGTPRIQVRRFASVELGVSVNRFWRGGIENPEVRELLLEIIETGRLGDCADVAYEAAIDQAKPPEERRTAIRALLQLSDGRLNAISNSVATDPSVWPDRIARHLLVDLFPKYLSVPQFSQILRRLKVDKRTIGEIDYWLPRKIENSGFSSNLIDQLRQALTDLIVDAVDCDKEQYPHFRTGRGDLVPALVAACMQLAKTGVTTPNWAKSSLLAIRLSKETHSEEDSANKLRSEIAELSPKEREAAFWAEAFFLQEHYKISDAWMRIYELSENGGIQLNAEKDEFWVRRCLSDPAKSVDQREMMLWAEMNLLRRREANESQFFVDLRAVVSDSASLVDIIDKYLKPPAYSADNRDWEKKHKERKNAAEMKAAKDHESWVKFWRELASNPSAAFAAGRAEHTAWNLWRAMAASGRESRASGWNRRFIEAQFGKNVADDLRKVMLLAWRKDRPTLRSERSQDEKGTYFEKWLFGLAAIAAEAEDPDWAKALSEDEAELACRYVPLEFSGFPYWLEGLSMAQPTAIDRVLGEELSLSLRENDEANSHSALLQDVSQASPEMKAVFTPRIRTWLEETAAIDHNQSVSDQKLAMAMQILAKNGTDHDRLSLEDLAALRLGNGMSAPHSEIWLPVLLQLNPSLGVQVLEKGLKEISAQDRTGPIKWFANLFGRDHGRTGVNLSAPGFTPDLLLRLVRLAYQNVRISDDAHHEGGYSPDTRDYAEKGRNALLSALLATTGTSGWAAKLELANDPLLTHFKDRAIALAEEKAAEEADGVPLTEAGFTMLDSRGETQPTTTGAMFALMRDRLEDIDDLLLQDVSPRELWASIKDERVLRRELARALRSAANQIYTVDQEAATADEKETDIRLRATNSSQQGIIELKVGEKNRTAAELRATLKDQLLTKYMAADDCRAGCLVISIAKDRNWKHPDTKLRLDFDGLIACLNEEAVRLSLELGGAAKLMAKGLDLRPRLATEKNAPRATSITDD
jgi:hypothetical protein